MRLPAPQHFIDGEFVDAPNDETIDVLDPSTGENFAAIARGRQADIDRAVIAARTAFEGAWGAMPAFERGRLLSKLGHRVLEEIDRLAWLEARDVGKPLAQARADVVALARYCEFYGGAADKLHGETIPYQAGYTVMTFREPHGVTGHIVPWNYPMQITGRSVGAALAMGNACVVKPGEDASLTALAFAELAAEVGFPNGAINVVTGLGIEAGAPLAAHKGIDHVSFTGSVATGRSVQAAAAQNTVPVTLELGGKSPQLIFADADLDAALGFVVKAAIQNAGQTCSAGSRLLIERPIYDAFIESVADRFRTLTVGPALDDHHVGPIVNAKQRDRVVGMIDAANRAGASVLAEGRIVDGAPGGGFYVAPTLLGGAGPGDTIARDEVFGPVLAAMPFNDEADAVRMANGTDYGLVAGVWTKDGARQMRLAHRLQAGQVFVNNYGAGGGVELPFGGVKRSGHGREKGFEALYGFSTLKTVAIHHG